jgi:hypothetical protein
MADPALGQLLPEPYQPVPKQPGGIGHIVTDPTQTVGEKNGMFAPGCSHSINSYDIKQASVGGVPKKLAVCPMCGYVQAILPVAQFDSDAFTFIA